MSHSSINANIVLQTMQKDQNTVQNSRTIKNVNIASVRDEDKNVLFLRISPTTKVKGMTESLGYPILDLQVFDKFADEGKATLKLTKSSVQIMINNCPPFELKHFLTTLKVKTNSAVTKVEHLCKPSNAKNFHLTNISALDVISPLRKSDAIKIHQKRLSDHFHDLKPITPDRKRLSNFHAEDFITPPKKPMLSHYTSTPIETKQQNEVDKIFAGIKPPLTKAATMNNGSLNDSFLLDEHYDLSQEQIRIIERVKSGENVFYTGSAGTGKTFLIKRIIGNLPPDVTAVTASTGVAASLIDGNTLHSFAGIGGVIQSLQTSIDIIGRKPLILQLWRKCKHLIIDEISLITAEYFDHLDQIGRVIRNCHNKPFGGIQLILSGDFLQLPPVITGNVANTNYKFAFQSKVWKEAFDDIMELTIVRRQSEKDFVDLLNQIRIGRCPDWANEKLLATEKQMIELNGIVPTKLCTHKVDVEELNNSNLKALKGDSVAFAANDSAPNKQSSINQMCRAEPNLILKIGAQVMLIKNIDIPAGLVNGARGVVVKFSSTSENRYPVIKFMSGKECVIVPEKFTLTITDSAGPLLVTRKQLPLKLAYALSIHKSQGMTLDCVELYLSKTFEAGQAYVALSRCKSLKSMRVIHWSKSCVRANIDVLKFYKERLATMINDNDLSFLPNFK